jgi:hypothetical protein
MDTTNTFISRFRRPVFLWAVASLATELAVQRLFEQGGLSSRLRLLTLLPLLPVTFFVLALGRVIRRMDELQKRICFEAVAIAFVLTLVLNFLLRSLVRAGLAAHAWDDMAEYMMIFWGGAYLFTTWRYRRPSTP